MMIDALRYLSDENNKIARAQLAIAYQNEVLQKNMDWNTLLLLPIENYLPSVFLEKQRELRFMPLYELLEELFSIFEMGHIKEQDAYLFAFFDAVTDYLQSNSSELDSFIRYWDETLCSKTIPSGEVEGIRSSPSTNPKDWNFIQYSSLSAIGNWKMKRITNWYGVLLKRLRLMTWTSFQSITRHKWPSPFTGTIICRNVFNCGWTISTCFM